MTEHERRLNDARASLTDACSACFMLWAAETAGCNVPKYARRLATLDWQCMHAQKRVWQQHTVKEESETGTQVETVVVLPAQPSGFVANFLCRLSSEVNTVGGHTVGRNVLLKLAEDIMAVRDLSSSHGFLSCCMYWPCVMFYDHPMDPCMFPASSRQSRYACTRDGPPPCSDLDTERGCVHCLPGSCGGVYARARRTVGCRWR